MKKILAFIPLVFLAASQLVAKNPVLLYINTNNGLCNVIQLTSIRDSLQGLGIKLVTTNYNKDLRKYLRVNNLDFLLKYELLDLSNNSLFSEPPDYSKFIVTDTEIKSVLYEKKVCETKGYADMERIRFYANFSSENIPLPKQLQNSSYVDIKYDNHSFFLRRKYDDKIYKISLDGRLDSFEVQEELYEDILRVTVLDENKIQSILKNRNRIIEEENYNQFVSIDNYYCSDSFLYCTIRYFVPEITGDQALMVPKTSLAKIDLADKDIMIYNLPESCKYKGSIYNVSSFDEFKIVEDTIIVSMSDDDKNAATDTPFFFMAKYVLNEERSGYIPVMLELELPEYFIENKFYYSYNGLKLTSDYVAFNWIPEIYNWSTGTIINLEINIHRMLGLAQGANNIKYYLYAVNFKNNMFQTIIFREGDLTYNEFDTAGNLIYEREISLNYRDYCSYAQFVDERKFALVNCNKGRIEIFDIPK